MNEGKYLSIIYVLIKEHFNVISILTHVNFILVYDACILFLISVLITKSLFLINIEGITFLVFWSLILRIRKLVIYSRICLPFFMGVDNVGIVL